MKRALGGFLVALFFVLAVQQTQSYWVLEKGNIVWRPGEVLGDHTSNVLIFFSKNNNNNDNNNSAPSVTPSSTPALTISPSLSPTSPTQPKSPVIIVPSDTPTPTPYNWTAGGTANVGQTIVLTSTPTPTVAMIRVTPTSEPVNPFGYLADLFAQPFIPTSTPTPQPTVPPVVTTHPSVTPVVPTVIPPTAVPTLPAEFGTQTKTTTQDVYVLNNAALSSIVVMPNTSHTSSVTVPTEPQQQQQQTILPTSQQDISGLLVALQAKTGAQVVSPQDEVTVKRGNQTVSITSQGTLPIVSTNTTSNASSSKVSTTPHLSINANNVVASSDMAISIDPLTGILVVNTPTGPQKVSIMPDEALGIITTLQALTTQGKATNLTLSTDNGKLVYHVIGVKVAKLLGLLAIPLQKEVVVSADTGGIVRVTEPFLTQLLSMLTF